MLERNESDTISGDLVFKIEKDLKQKVKKVNYNSQTISFIEKEWAKGKETLRRTEKILENILKLTISFSNNNIDSKLINDPEVLDMFLDNRVLRYERIHRSSENGFNQSAAVGSCANIEHTVFLIQTEFDKVIGGYTPLVWKKGTGTALRVEDKAKKSFMFSISNAEKYPLVDDTCAIQNNSEYFPKFGHGADLAIEKNPSSGNGSYVTFKSYLNPHIAEIGTEAAIKEMTGNPTGGKNFRVKEMEIFRVYMLPE